MRHVLLMITAVACVSFTTAGISLADVPEPANCVVSDGTLVTCPVVHDPPEDGSSRYVDLVVTLYTTAMDPVEGFAAGNFVFTVIPHPDYPNLGGGVSGDCPNCDALYSVYTMAAATDIDGDMPIRVDLGTGCAPSMCCPVHVIVDIPQGEILDRGEVLQNSVDAAPNGAVDLGDIGYFATARADWVNSGIPRPCADFVFGPSLWGDIELGDIGMFTQHMNHMCEPFDDPCN